MRPLYQKKAQIKQIWSSQKHPRRPKKCHKKSQWGLEGGLYEQGTTNHPILAEIQALRQGLLIAIHHNLMPLDINSDSTKLITYLEHNNHPYTNLTLECRLLIEKLGAALPTHIQGTKSGGGQA
ncbi:hypothetical protein KY289_037582 [Solanum tuberosum]|nr:hypothetical protein KY284_034924 [Solanum tuberosum]KAH0637667.1 hypothetical protein KY289_037582 [Solanum tuberosum]